MNKTLDKDTAIFRLSQGEFEISGNVDFVKEQLINFKPSIDLCLNQLANSFSQVIDNKVTHPQKLLTTNTHKEPRTFQSQSAKTEDIDYVEVSNAVSFENVLVIENNKVQIIADVPGDSTAKRMINLILIYLWGKHQLGIDETHFSELRDMCGKYGEIDGPNFSKHMNNHKKFFLIDGAGKGQVVRLIRPGIKEAIRIISELNKNK